MTVEHEKDLPLEQATNRRYLDGLDRFLAAPVIVGMAANEKWLGNAPVTGKGRVGLAGLAGRVRLDHEDPDLGSAFYIGPRRLSEQWFDHPVVSWDAPVAKIFYEPGSTEHELGASVLVRRTLLSQRDRIVNLHDEWRRGHTPESPAFQREELAVPSAPPSPAVSRRRQAAPSTRHASVPTPPAPSGAAAGGGSAPRSEARPSSPRATSPVAMPPELTKGMRSAEVVGAALAAPRSQALTSLLATLQPDQYALVTADTRTPLVVQGHPGTGKTIIATHRAAFLVSAERTSDQRARNTLFIGPSPYWVEHVRGALGDLDTERKVTVDSVLSWLKSLVGQPGGLTGDPDGSPEDADARLLGLARSAAQLHSEEEGWATDKRAATRNLRDVYSIVWSGSSRKGTPLAGWNDYAHWARKLPPFEQAVLRRRHQGLLAAIALAVQGGPSRLFDHIVVDEAQDVSPLEWSLLQAHCRGGWTLVGDMNQRRNDLGFSSWEQLIMRLRLGRGGTEITPTVVSRGYRSTQAILDFAKPLLPARERSAKSLQSSGARPHVEYVPAAKNRNPAVIAEAEKLCDNHPSGTVAVIVVLHDLKELEQAFSTRGWTRGELNRWRSSDDRYVSILTPASARGMEFDAVVVVEPADFPKNLGRVGALYTSLTRANRELTVVHHKALPDALRRYNRR